MSPWDLTTSLRPIPGTCLPRLGLESGIKGVNPSYLPLTLPTETAEPRHSGPTGKSNVISVFAACMAAGIGGGLRQSPLSYPAHS